MSLYGDIVCHHRVTQKGVSMSKDSTIKQIINALAHLLATEGFHAIGINAIAREAGVDKVLIYRYFDISLWTSEGIQQLWNRIFGR